MRSLQIKFLMGAVLTFFVTSGLAQKPRAYSDLNRENEPKRSPPVFKQIDQDQDGVITLDEFKQHKIPHGDHETVFSHIDCDGDGLISEQELTKHRPPRRRRM